MNQAVESFWSSKVNIEPELPHAYVKSEELNIFSDHDSDPYKFDSDSSLETEHNDYHGHAHNVTEQS